MKDYTDFLSKYFGGYHGRINPPRLVVDDDGVADFDIGSERLYFSAANSYGGLIGWYLYYKMNPKWIESQLKLASDQMHPLANWHYLALRHPRNLPDKNPREFCGAEICWQLLGYHLALIGEHAELSSKLIKRLRDPNHFQGARFEIAVAAAMIVAGFTLEYKPEKGNGKHPEFIATDIDSGIKIAVEAKSKKRNEILGYADPGVDQASIEAGVRRLLRDAVDKDTELPLLVFVETNLPNLFSAEYNEVEIHLDLALERFDISRWQEVGFPCIGGFFVNDAAAHYLEEQIDLSKKYAWVRRFKFENRHNFDAEIYLSRIAEGFAKSARIPDINWYNARISK